MTELPNNLYRDLKAKVKDAGLLDNQPLYYTYKMVTSLLAYGVTIAFLFIFDNFWLHIANAILMGLVWVHFGFLAHDASHRQVFKGSKGNDNLFLLVGNLLIGMDMSYWYDKHNAHHAHSNDVVHDPDINFPIVFFDERQLEDRTPFQKFLMRYQAFYFFPLLSFITFAVLYESVASALSSRARYPFWQIVTLSVHYILYFSLIFAVLPFWTAMVFWILQFIVSGVYMGMVFAPNHKGMPIVDGQEMDFLHQQVLTSRNVFGNFINDFMYGGLNYQIEHHLFPSMPRNKLKDAQKIVKAFCAEHDISYHETGVIRSYWEILADLHRVSSVLRRKKQVTNNPV